MLENMLKNQLKLIRNKQTVDKNIDSFVFLYTTNCNHLTNSFINKVYITHKSFKAWGAARLAWLKYVETSSRLVGISIAMMDSNSIAIFNAM